MSYRILIAEDDPLIAVMLYDNLIRKGFAAESVESGDKVMPLIRSFTPDLILLDLMLPKLDGFQICRAVSESATRVPIIVISARSEARDKVRALGLGADDYLTKPFRLDELLARVYAVMRRARSAPQEFELGSIFIDLNLLRATKGGKPLHLTGKEFEILRLLALHRGAVVTREQLLRSIWGFSEVPLTRSVDHLIAKLRAKIEPDPHHPRYLHTLYGEGYSLTVKGTEGKE